MFPFLAPGKYEKAQQGSWQDVGPGGSQLIVGLHDSRNSAVDEYAKESADHTAHILSGQRTYMLRVTVSTYSGYK